MDLKSISNARMRQKPGAIALVLLLAATAGWSIGVAVEQDIGDSDFWLLLPAVVAPALLLAAMRPVFSGILVLSFAFVNPAMLPPLSELGEISLRYIDVAFGVLVFMVWSRMVVGRHLMVLEEFKKLFVPLLPFLLYIGVSLALVRISTLPLFAVSLASYLRLMLTAAFALILHLALYDSRDMSTFNKALLILCVVALGVGIWQAWSGLESGEVDTLTGRFGGSLNVNTFGLISGLLVLYAFLKRDVKCLSVWWLAPLASGLFGLFLSKSASSILATAGAVSVYMSAMRPRRSKGSYFFRWVATSISMVAASVLAIWIWRQDEVLGLFDTSSGSFAQRLMIAYAGLKIFLEHPLIGVGWQASAAEMIISAPTLNMVLMQSFGELPTHYFFLDKPTSLHNMYIQFFAELGIIGFALFIHGCFRMGKVVKTLVNNIPADSPYKLWAQFYALGLVFLLIWWNTNPLFGGQTESILAFTFLAALAAVARLERQRIGQTNGETRGIG
jgi:hypothetical protein